MKILLIEDDQETALTLKSELSSLYIVEYSLYGEEGEMLALNGNYDLIILDYILPDTNGITVCKNLRASKILTPILMLTAKDTVEDKVSALNAGADDYLTKPFSLDEFNARVKALIRRSVQAVSNNTLQIGELSLDLNRKVARRGRRLIRLSKKEFYLLEYLARNVGRIISREMILSHVWESENEPLTNTIDVHIRNLRRQVDDAYERKLIKTIYGLGYRLEA